MIGTETIWFYSPYDNATLDWTVSQGKPGDPAISGNLNVTDDGVCFGQIKADPDIAGWGVFAGFAFNIMITIVCSFWFLWVPYVCKLRAQGLVEEDKSDIGTVQEVEDLTPAEGLVLALGDTNLVSALAAIISSATKISQDPQYPVYHIALGRALASMAISGHGAGKEFVYDKLRRHHPISLRLRFLTSICLLIIYIIWTLMSAQRFREWETSHWPFFTPMCFSLRLNHIPGTYSLWMYLDLAWMPSGYTWLMLSPFKSDFLLSLYGKADALTLSICRSIYGCDWCILRPPPLPGRRPWKTTVIILSNILTIIAKLLFTLFWFSFSLTLFPTPILQPFHDIFNLSLSLYDVLVVKVANMHLVVDVLETSQSSAPPSNPELEFGFGQIFSLTMFLLSIIAVLDATSARSRIKSKDNAFGAQNRHNTISAYEMKELGKKTTAKSRTG